jgi:hypothetical protein
MGARLESLYWRAGPVQRRESSAGGIIILAPRSQIREGPTPIRIDISGATC